LTGHGSLRAWSGALDGEATRQEIERMKELLRLDLESGSWGLSTGLEYYPGLYASREELMQLAEVAGRYDGIVMSHMRSEDNIRLEESLDELAAQGAFARVHASHLKAVYGKGIKRAEEILQYIQAYRNQGIKLTADTYPYAASYTGIAIVFPDWSKTQEQWKQAMKDRPGELRRFIQEKVERRNGPEAILFGSGSYAGKTLKEVADLQGADFVNVLLEMGPQAASAAHFVMDEVLQDRIATAESIMISSDGSPTMHHPRGYGSFAKVIRRYVVEQGSLSLEEAVHKMSGLPAKTLGMQKRGIIRVGYKADLLIFEPHKVRDLATFEYPHRLAEGFDWVWVNGKTVREKGQSTGERPGEVLRKGATE
jgi:N-acyl-D-amino-acid deacylase